MSHFIKSLFVIFLLTGCAAATPTATAPEIVSTETSLPPTEAVPAATATLGISGIQVSVPVLEDNESFNATITGNGEIAIILGNTVGNDPLRWAPLVAALESNENLRIVTFAYRSEATDTSNPDTRAVFDYLRTEGITKIICVGSGYGSSACGYLQNEPEIIGMVIITVDHISKIEAGFPKLFLTADTDSVIPAAVTQRIYEQSTEPKAFKSYESGRHGTGLFTDPNVGSQVLADITDFINEVVSSH